MSFDNAVTHFQKVDPILYEVAMRVHRPEEIVPVAVNKYFEDLCDTIVSQQLSGKVAKVIWDRIKVLVGKITPENVLKVPDEKYRAAGCSWAKIKYIKDLATRNIDFTDFPSLSNSEITKRLVEVKGIGPWTAEMFLMFTMGKPDIFSEGDLGLKNAIKKLYKKAPKPEVWSPYRTYACRILWRSLEL